MLTVLALISPKPTMHSISETSSEVGKLYFKCYVTGGTDCYELIEPLLTAYQTAMYPKGEPLPQDVNALINVQITMYTAKYGANILYMDEEYVILVTYTYIQIKTNTPDGLARAFATLCYLIEPDPAHYYENGRYIISHYEIQDKPVYRYRYLLVDVARHFLSVETLKRISLGLSLAKINVLHVHIIDNQANSFAAETKPADNMQRASWQNGKNFMLTKDDLREIQQYIRPLGMFLMVEYDMPGHASSWRKADPTIVTKCPRYDYSTVNPINELTYQYIESYIRDIFEAATYSGATPMLHLGGDEVEHQCWNDDEEIVKYMNETGISTVKLWQQFHARVLKIVKNVSADAFIEYWQESYENGNEMAPNAIVNFWANTHMLMDCLMEEHYAVRTQGWYFDVVEQGESRYLFQDSWMDFYAVDIGKNVLDSYKTYLLGGGACLWGEYVDSGSIDDFAFPRIIAVSESLWSAPANREITKELTERFNEFACKTQQIGIKNGPLAPSKPCAGIDSA